MEKIVVVLIFTLVGVTKGQDVPTRTPYYDSLFMDHNFVCEGSSRIISQNQIYRVEVSEENPPIVNCSVKFEAEHTNNCSGSCYLFVPNAFIKHSGIQFTIGSGSNTMTFTLDNPILRGPQCSAEDHMTVTFTPSIGYKYNRKERTFHFTVEIYNKCGERGSVRNIKFDEAIKYVIGYHIDGEREERERSTFVDGILLGFGLSFCFLIVFAIAYCYNRSSPNRAPSRSIDITGSIFKKKRRPSQKSQDKAKAIEMDVRHKSPGSHEKQEDKPLLVKEAISDPENPPLDKEESSAVTEADDGKEGLVSNVDNNVS